MSAKKKPKQKAEKEDLRLPEVEAVDEMFPGHGEETVSDIAGMFEARTRLDPQARVPRPIAVIFAPVIEGTANDITQTLAGKFLVSVIQEGDLAFVEELFSDITSMMKQKAALAATGEKPHRHARAMLAYTTFKSLYSKEPSKPILKKFILKNTEKLGTDWPPEEDGTGWTRVWRKAGLSFLSDR